MSKLFNFLKFSFGWYCPFKATHYHRFHIKG